MTPTWTVAPAPAVVPVASYPTAATGQRTLAATGVDVGSLTVLGGLATALGGAALLARRRAGRST